MCKILSDRMLRIKGSAEHYRCTCVDRHARSADEQLHNNAPHRKCLEKDNCRRQLVCTIEDDTSTTSQTPTAHYTNACVELTIVTYLSFSERIAIANLSLLCSSS